jgi:hypothetical protein
MNAQRNGTCVDLNKHSVVAMSSLVGLDTIHKSVLGATVDEISRQQCNRSSPMDKMPSSMQFCPLRRGPNGLMARFLVITIVLTIWGVGLMVIMISTTISLHYGEVPCCAVLISRRSSSFANLPSAKSPLEPSVNFLSFISSY